MPRILLADIKNNIINKQNVAWSIQFKIWDFEQNLISESLFKKHILEYSWNQSRNFSSATARLVLLNPEGIYSADNPNALIKTGFTIQIEEFFQNYPDETFERFYGFIRQINPIKNASGDTVGLNCYDLLIKLQNTDIDKTFESAEKEFVEADELTPNNIEGKEYLSQIFDSKFSNWAESPPPQINVFRKIVFEVANYAVDGFEINYPTGQVVLNKPMNTQNYVVYADYFYYKTGLYGEDIIKKILEEPDGFGNPLFDASYFISDFLTKDRISVDKLKPVISPMNLTSKIEAALTTSSTYFIVPRRDSWKFKTNYSGTIGNIKVDWTTKENIILHGSLQATKINLVNLPSENIAKGTTVSVFYSPGANKETQIWRTAYNNILSSRRVAHGNFPHRLSQNHT